MSKVLFMGLGHLGNLFLQQNNSHNITGTKRNSDDNMSCHILEYCLGTDWNYGNDFDVVIISFTPVESYAKHLEKLLNSIGDGPKIILISSTSVFGSGQINEGSEKIGRARNAQELIKCEELIQKLPNFLIVRPGGLIDEKRHPQNFTKKMVKITSSNTNVNLVHTNDVAAFLHFAIDHNLTNEDFNLVCDDHPTKAEFYARFNDTLAFDSENSELRIIDNSKSKKTGFKYQFDNLDWC